jgi:hypothetical protein
VIQCRLAAIFHASARKKEMHHKVLPFSYHLKAAERLSTVFSTSLLLETAEKPESDPQSLLKSRSIKSLNLALNYC